MRRDINRTFYFIETENDNGNHVFKVASDSAPLWGQDFNTFAEAVDAVQRRNKGASFVNIHNGIIAKYADANNVS